MKKILLTLFVGFCFGAVAVAQEPAKAAKKKALATTLNASESKPATAEMIKAKQADFKANHSGKPATAATVTGSKAASKAVERATGKAN